MDILFSFAALCARVSYVDFPYEAKNRSDHDPGLGGSASITATIDKSLTHLSLASLRSDRVRQHACARTLQAKRHA